MTGEHEHDEDPQPEYKGGIPIFPGPAEREKAARVREKEEEREYKKDNRSIQLGIFVTQAFLVVFGILGTCVSIYQAGTARDSAEQARRAADLASDSFEAAYGDHGTADRMMTQTINQTEAQVKSANAAKEAIRAARDQMRLDQRAWIAYDPQQTKVTGRPGGLVFTAGYRNYGKTPAYKVLAFSGVTNQLISIPDSDKPTTSQAMIVPPGAPAYTSVYPIPTTLDSIKNGAKWYLFGTVWYQDAFGRDHWTQFCYFPFNAGTDEMAFGPCGKHNSTDDSPPS